MLFLSGNTTQSTFNQSYCFKNLHKQCEITGTVKLDSVSLPQNCFLETAILSTRLDANRPSERFSFCASTS